VRDPDIAWGRLTFQHANQIEQLAFGAAPDHLAIVLGANPGAVIAAIFHPPETIDESICHRMRTHDPDNAAHCPDFP
jgi:hypothetical protein